MFKKMKHMKNEKGLTLIELLAVIVILAIIAAIAIPAIGNIINNQRDKAILSDVSGLVSSAKLAYADGSCSGTTCTYTTTASTNQVEFSSNKVDTDATVNFTTSTNPTVKFKLTSGTTFKSGGKIQTALTGKLASGEYTLTEEELNELMESGTITP